MSDYQAKARPAGYFDDLLRYDPEKLMRKYSVCPPNDVAAYRGDDVQTFVGVKDDLGDIVHRRIRTDRKIAYVSLSRKPRGHSVMTGNEGGDTIVMQAQYAPAAHLVPIWWLPWESGGGAIELNIPLMGTQQPGEPDPRIFFTAAINGCSIFVRGNPDRPRVVHCGGDTCKGADHAAAAGFWRDIMTNNVLNHVVDPTLKEVNKTDYIKTPGYQNSTQAALKYKKWLGNHSSSRVELSMVNPWGCVMGIRDDAGNWKFFLQENVTVIYKLLEKKKHAWSKKKYQMESNLDGGGNIIIDTNTNLPVQVVKQRYVSRPLIVREIYPNTQGGGARLPLPIPDVVHG